MSYDDPRTSSSNEATVSRRRVSSSTAVIVAMVLVWGGVILSRNVIRSYWWAYRVTNVESAEDRLAYFHRLASLGNRGVPAVDRLLEHLDPGIRSLGVGVLHQTSSAAGLSRLIAACNDADVDVRRLAILGLAHREQADAIEPLLEMIGTADERTAMIAVSAIAAVGGPRAEALLVQAVRHHAHVGVRVEAIERLEARGLGAVNATVSDEVILALIDVVHDDGVFEGLTESGLIAERVFHDVRAEAATETAVPFGVEAEIARRHVVGERGEEALEYLTGHAIDEKPGEVVRTRTERAARWRQWWTTSR
ncbi:MAG: HEAT repeat domain-containing protein [Planctomycetes bacterium]|nr:HEAT repeat domain-containing protein [Planctomycetota bacterium]